MNLTRRTSFSWLVAALALAAALLVAGLPRSEPAAADRRTRADGDLNTQIVGGTVVPIGEYRFTTFMEVDSGFGTIMCGASLIDPEWVLTAAHCVDGSGAGDITVWVGANDLDDLSGSYRRTVTQLSIHPDYDPYSQDNDAALLRLASAVPNAVTPVALPAAGSSLGLAAGTELTVVGWGRTSEGGYTSDRLREVDVPVTTDAYCQQAYGLSAADIAVVFCAGREAGGVDSCQGDSGGPIFLQQGGTVTQIGVVSYGTGCARPGLPGVYTRLAAPVIRDWIAGVTGDGPLPTPTPTPPPGPDGPSVSIVKPVNNQTLKKKVFDIVVEATDDVGVESVEFWACWKSECSLIDTLSSPPWAMTVKGSNGTWELYAVATDTDGNSTQSDSVFVSIKQKKKHRAAAAETAAPAIERVGERGGRR